MQTSTSDQRSATPQGLETRFALVRAFLLDRGVKNYMSVFAALGLELEERRDEITSWWNSRTRITPDDEPVIAAMEGGIERLKNEKL